MSDQINTLIHSNARMAYDQGRKTEYQRIINLLTDTNSVCGRWAVEIIEMVTATKQRREEDANSSL